jgi:hypothetical protein
MPKYRNTCPDCGRFLVLTRGYCLRDYTRRLRDGTLVVLSDDDRFWRRVAKDPAENGCWLWTASTVSKEPGRAYGLILYEGVRMGTHRCSWIIHNGPIPAGLEVCHNCPTGDNPRCVNPAHLFLGTHAENMADMGAKGRAGKPDRRGEKAGRTAKLTEAKVREIRALYSGGGWSHSTLARRFGVCDGTIQHITQRKTWSHLDDHT